MHGLPILICLQHQNRGTLGIFWVALDKDAIFHATYYFAGHQSIISEFIISVV